MIKIPIIPQETGKKNFVTWFPPLYNTLLIKPEGMIGNLLAKEHGYNSYIVCFDKGQEFEYNKTIVPFVKILKIPGPKKHRMNKTVSVSELRFLQKNAKQIDVLQFYHFSQAAKVLSIVYKILNHRGCILITMDATEGSFQSLQNQIHKGEFLAKLRRWVLQKFIELCPDILTIETTTAYSAMQKIFNSKKIHLRFSGIDTHTLQTNGFMHPLPSEKENIIITVGRIGCHQKNNEMMLDALRNVELKDWMFVFIGPIEDAFKSKIEQFYASKPSLRCNVIFTGNVEDRKELYSWYKKAKVFCLTSRFESWCLAMGDALYFGCEIVSTPISSLPDLTDNGAFGHVVHDASELRACLQKIVSGEIGTLQSMEKIIAHSGKFSWRNICNELNVLLTRYLSTVVMPRTSTGCIGRNS